MPIRTLSTLLTQREAAHELGVSERRIAALHEFWRPCRNEDSYAAPEGITELIDATNDLCEGLRAADKDIAHFKPYRKRVFSQSVVATATTSGAVTGAVPIPFPDAAILGPIEIAQIQRPRTGLWYSQERGLAQIVLGAFIAARHGKK
jgi:hypothetical protein